MTVLFISCLFLVGGLSGSIWILIDLIKRQSHELVSVGVCLLVQNLLILTSAGLLRLEGAPSGQSHAAGMDSYGFYGS